VPHTVLQRPYDPRLANFDAVATEVQGDVKLTCPVAAAVSQQLPEFIERCRAPGACHATLLRAVVGPQEFCGEQQQRLINVADDRPRIDMFVARQLADAVKPGQIQVAIAG
jgi:hypothetical protein